MQRRSLLQFFLLAITGLAPQVGPTCAAGAGDVPLPGTKVLLDLADGNGRTVHAEEFVGRWL